MGATAKRAIDDLISKSSSPRVAKATLVKIEADLRVVLKAEKDGRSIPSCPALAEFFSKQYGKSVSPSSVRNWLRTLRLGNSITR